MQLSHTQNQKTGKDNKCFGKHFDENNNNKTTILLNCVTNIATQTDTIIGRTHEMDNGTKRMCN